MKILLISYYYPPDRAVGGQRARKVVEVLRAAGHEVVVIAAGDTPAGQGVHRVTPLPSVRDVYAALRRRYGNPRDDHASNSAGAPMTSGTAAIPFWKRWMFSLIWLPDSQQGFILPAVLRSMRLRGGRPDIIYTTAPPFSVHLAGLIVTVLTGARWVAEFRDPWTTNPWKPAHMRSAISEWLERKLEWLCLETADLLVSVSDGIAKRLADTDTTTPITTVRNGIEELRAGEQLSAAPPSEGPFEIVYAGSFYYTRDPFPFLTAVKQVISDLTLDPSDFRVRFIGATDAYEGRSIGKFVRRSNLDEYVLLEKWMEPGRSLRYVRRADALLLLALDQPDQVPNKLYEYLGARRPILAVADETGETVRMLNAVGGHTIVSVNDSSRILPALREILRKGRRSPVGDPRVLAGWTTAAQMRRLCQVVAALHVES